MSKRPERPVSLYTTGQPWVAHLKSCPDCAAAAREMRPHLRCEAGEALRQAYKDALEEHANRVHNALGRLRMRAEKRSRNGNQAPG